MDKVIITVSIDGKNDWCQIAFPVNDETKKIINEMDRQLYFKLEYLSEVIERYKKQDKDEKETSER